MPRKAALGLTFVRFLMSINQANQWWFPLRNLGFLRQEYPSSVKFRFFTNINLANLIFPCLWTYLDQVIPEKCGRTDFKIHYSRDWEPIKIYDFVFTKLLTGIIKQNKSDSVLPKRWILLHRPGALTRHNNHVLYQTYKIAWSVQPPK